MNYDGYSYLYPPRPEQRISPQSIGFYERRGFLAQKKRNGTNTVIFTDGSQVIFKTRHNTDHKLWEPLPAHIEFFHRFAGQGWHVFCAELVHSKVAAGPKNELYIFDMLVHRGQFLLGSKFKDRAAILQDMFTGQDEGDQVRIAPHYALAKNYTGGFKALYNSLRVEDEGLVLKDPEGKLEMCTRPESNNVWNVKARIPAKNYSF